MLYFLNLRVYAGMHTEVNRLPTSNFWNLLHTILHNISIKWFTSQMTLYTLQAAENEFGIKNIQLSSMYICISRYDCTMQTNRSQKLNIYREKAIQLFLLLGTCFISQMRAFTLNIQVMTKSRQRLEANTGLFFLLQTGSPLPGVSTRCRPN